MIINPLHYFNVHIKHYQHGYREFTKTTSRRRSKMKKKLLLLAAVAILALSVVLTGCSKSPAWKDGVYDGKGEGVHGDVKMSVEIKGGKIEKVNVVSQSETAGISDAAFEQVPSAIVKKQSAEVETVAGATVSSKAIITAVKEALGKAK
jgi:uncharacterized protein with FMN-binding domain